ncbi:transglutaminase-like domain-containing protein [Alteromonas facilis]|uniref:transglutaminase-like domain-containing protein n=1 Tax=Alteromonas facilis TaxID=2048004 RepID=UPI000C290191|nr:transglutaminase-like domain-containing protein [Alteromonas facilis]
MQVYLTNTPILDFQHSSIQQLVAERAWQALPAYERIGAVYDFVRNEIVFGYNKSDDIPASLVLADGYGQCNTKGSLLMALLRAVGIECRFHGFTIDQALQKGAIPSLLFGLAPRFIIHSWVEVLYQGEWIALEGFILDEAYLRAVQRKFDNIKGAFCGYGIATDCFQEPGVEWQGKATFIQHKGIADDFGLYDSPDDFYRQYGTNLSGVKRWFYQHFARHIINWNVRRLRKG